MRRYIYKDIICALIMVGIFVVYCNSSALASESAVVFAYQYIDNLNNPQKTITLDQFENHLKEIKKSKYSILPLVEIIDNLKNNISLPDKTIAIVFKETDKETLKKVLPIFEASNIPCTVFFSAESINSENELALNQGYLKEIYKEGTVDLGIIPYENQSLIGKSQSEIAEMVNRSIVAYQEITGKDKPDLFAYPKGEYSSAIKDRISSYKFKASITENMGAIDKDTDFNLTPAFTINSDYSNLDRFINATYALPIKVSEITPQDSIVKKDTPVIGFTVNEKLENLENITCFASDIGKLNTTVLEGKRIEIRLNQPLISAKTSINCTLPVRKDVLNKNENPWKCFSMLLIKQ